VTSFGETPTNSTMAQRIDNIEIRPEPDALRSLQLSSEDFYRALTTALDGLEGKPPKELPTPSDILLVVRGQRRSLGELASIAVTWSSAPGLSA
jgi:hypothetical protein